MPAPHAGSKPGSSDSKANGENLTIAADFLRRRFGTAPPDQYILVWTKSGNAKRSSWLPVSQLPHAESFLARFCTPSAGDVYAGVALSPKDFGPSNRCEADKVAGIAGLWADLDVKGEAHKQDNLPKTIGQARELARSIGLPPTEEIHTGHGLQAYWEFTTPWIFRDDADRQKAADLVRRFQALLKEKAKAKGWEIDSTHDLARVLRLPGTWNHKTGDPAPVRVLTSGEEPTT
jgi:putative DNA primase/helicase